MVQKIEKKNKVNSIFFQNRRCGKTIWVGGGFRGENMQHQKNLEGSP